MTSAPAETCDQCGFDSTRWTTTDATQTVGLGSALVIAATQDIDVAHWNVRPRASTWSVGEYVDHLCSMFFMMRAGSELASMNPGAELPPIVEPGFEETMTEHDSGELIDRLATESIAGHRFFSSIGGDGWSSHVMVNGETWTIERALKHLCHDLMHHLADIAEIRHDIGDAFVTMKGTISQLSASGGGVPKLAVAAASIDAGGLVGDTQNARRHHGRPWQAICLYSSDVIADLRLEGHPISAGSTGENLTLAGLDWSKLQGGLIVRSGEVTLRLSAPAVPCSKNDRWFHEGNRSRMDHDLHPGWSRWYASVLTGGNLETGDAVSIESVGATQ